MVSVDEARRRLGTVRPHLEPEAVAVAAALGRTLAEPVYAPVDLPPFTRAAMDGFALRAADTARAPVVLPVRGETPAGSPPGRLEPGTVHRIWTGAPLPAGADAVLEQEAAGVEGDAVRILRPVPAGRNVMPRGHEVAAGRPVFGVGERLSSTHLALLASLGVTTVTVRRPLRAAVLQTGAELVEAGNPLAPGRIYATHGVWLSALVREWGGEPVAVETVGDDADLIARRLEALAAGADLVLVTGGTSVGRYDHVPGVLERLTDRLFWWVRMHPGRAVAAGRRGETLVLALSGNPGAAMTTWLVLAAPWWATVHGGRLVERTERLPLRDAYPKPSREPRYLRVRRTAAGLDWDLPQGADVLTAYLDADGFAVLPEGPPVPAGTVVDYWEPVGMGGRWPRWSGAR
ncbi:MAG: molybdopterin molybdotransferase MoeA [Actinomycetia bacterium]|nr:molybdopterin molybdotransferase MoeA [Actinomycetes bacterium]